MKSEPDVYSIDDLARDKRTFWDGVRNYAARNFMRDEMKKGDLAFFYHSNAEPSAVVGVVEIAREGRPDPTQFEPGDKMHYDPDSPRDDRGRYADPESPRPQTRADPRWFGVDVAFKEKLKRPVTLQEIKATPALRNMKLLKVSRLSVSPVTPAEWKAILAVART
jgi:predicted RNA-binding protein with PUA-like domain